jgi:hypothetical protein
VWRGATRFALTQRNADPARAVLSCRVIRNHPEIQTKTIAIQST